MRIAITIILFAFAATALAQDAKYDKAVISYYGTNRQLYISVNGKEYIEDSTAVHPSKQTESLHPFIAKIQEFENKGWLCVDIQAQPAAVSNRAYLAYLRKYIQ